MHGSAGRAAAILEQEAVEAAIERFAQGRLDATVGGDAGQDQVGDLLAFEPGGPIERASRNSRRIGSIGARSGAMSAPMRSM